MHKTMGLQGLFLASALLNAVLCSSFTRLEPVNLNHQFKPRQGVDFLPNEPAVLDIVQAVDRGEALQNIFEVENLGNNIAREIESVSFESDNGVQPRYQNAQQSTGFLRVLDRRTPSFRKNFHDVQTGGGLQPVVFRPCPGGDPVPTSLHVNCTSRVRDVCSLARGQSHSLVVGFTPTTSSSHAVVSLLSWRTWLELPLLGQDTRACSYMNCPLKKGKKTTLDYKLNIPDVVGQRRDTIIWRLFDKETRERLLCFTFRTHIT
ncbi:MD-2-related lipid-recognition domain [Trinorchestia longiramus]|nr:MD-2-related lipid-recognition domain [Trinorchestia longiramus]